MLELIIKEKEAWNAQTNEFIQTKETNICLEHSLVSLSKWESKYKKPFLSSEKTNAEVLDYIKMMTITQNVDPNIYNTLDSKELEMINSYIIDPMTATWFNERKSEGKARPKQNKETTTSELIYYWMISYQIPFECQKWHLNRLLTLIRICNVKDEQQNSKTSGKMSKRDILSQNRALNAARRQKFNTRG